MEQPGAMIVSALLAGAVAAAKDTASIALKDAYNGLKFMIQSRFKGNKAAEVALDESQKDPLIKAVAENNLDKDEEILAIYRKLVDLLKKEAPSSSTNVFTFGKVDRSAIGPNAQYIEHSDDKARDNKAQ